jgi:hypothetical protein
VRAFRMSGGPRVIVTIEVDEGLSVTLDTDDGSGYQPDVCDDLCARARDLFRLAMHDARTAHAEHDE